MSSFVPLMPQDETLRLSRLRSYDILDTPAEEVFDRIAKLAARYFGVPIALVSLVDEERQWFKARYGLDDPETPRSLAFCAHTILENRVMVVPNAECDPRFADNCLVTGPLHFRFYAGAPLITPDGLAIGTLSILDRKPRHTFAADSQRALAEFAQLVMHELERRQAMAQAVAARAEAQRANSAKTRFLAAASHDLRQPFQAMELLLGVLAQRLHDQKDHLALVGRVQEALHSGQGLLNGLLDIATLEAGTIQPTFSSFPIRSVIDRLAREMSELAAQRGLSLRVAGCRKTVRSDPLLLERVLRNLLSNALAHTQQGRVLIGCRQRGRMLRVEVWDTGPGIPPEQIDLIFEEFYQLGNPERNRFKGLGLGLAIVRRTADLLGHPIAVRSMVGRGTVFSVELPLSEANGSTLVSTAAPPGPDNLAGRTILVIEDEEQQRVALSMYLGELGCRTVAVASVEDAVARLGAAASAPDLVISNFRLTGAMTGTRAVAAIRRRLGRRVPAVLVTGDTDPHRLRQAKRAGCALLYKPFRPDVLRRALAQALFDSEGGEARPKQ